MSKLACNLITTTSNISQTAMIEKVNLSSEIINIRTDLRVSQKKRQKYLPFFCHCQVALYPEENQRCRYNHRTIVLSYTIMCKKVGTSGFILAIMYLLRNKGK